MVKFKFARLSRSPFVLTEHMTSNYVCMEVRVDNSSVCHAYVMCAELCHSHFWYVPAVSNVVTNGNGMGTNNV